MKRAWVSGMILCWALCVCFLGCIGDEIPPEIAINRDGYSQEMFWGSYRPGIYFGMKTRSATPIMSGLMWAPAYDYQLLRHQCRHEDEMSSYGWTMHNGRDFGQHEAVDVKLNAKVTASFLKESPEEMGGSWANRIRIQKIQAHGEDAISSFYYVIFPSECNLEKFKAKKKGVEEILLKGYCPDVENFSFTLQKGEGSSYPPSDTQKPLSLKKYQFMGLSIADEDSWDIQDKVRKALSATYQQEYFKFSKKATPESPPPKIVATLPNTIEENSNVFVFQVISTIPVTIDAVFLQHQSIAGSDTIADNKFQSYVNLLSGSKLTEKLHERKEDFNILFDNTFHLLEAQGLDHTVVPCAKSAFSNMIGGIGYFHGDSLIFEGDGKAPSVVHSKSLFSGVPSRPFFPRGFLWDEGFHQLLLSDWNVQITMDVMRHWLNLMDSTGWIPREQILGTEARSRVPAEFQAQHRDHANPPAFFLTLDKIHRKFQRTIEKIRKNTIMFADGEVTTSIEEQTAGIIEGDQYLKSVFAFLKEIYPRMAYWHNWMVESQSGIQENSYRWRGRTKGHTLASGMDDFPRAPMFSNDEAHLDLISWLALSARVLGDISTTINEDPTPHQQRYESLLAGLERHWDEKRGIYSDIMNITSNPITHSPHIGYVTLFPIMMGLLPDDSPRIPSILAYAKDSQHLWSGFGLRSLSKSDRLYRQGENYWRGPIWINMNYLFLSSLKVHYFSGPYEKEIRQTYSMLRQQLVDNIVQQFHTTGYIWEQYHEESGHGTRSRPFTGWSALILNIMSESY